MKKLLQLLPVLVLALSTYAGPGPTAPPTPAGLGKLTLDQAVQIALQRNANIRKAIQEIERTKGLIIEVRAQALPHIGITGNYTQQDRGLLESSRSSSSGASFSSLANSMEGGTPQQQQTADLLRALGQSQQSTSSTVIGDRTWDVRIEARQAIYTGGQVSSAMKIARFTEDSAYFSLRDVINRVISEVRQEFYDTLLQRSLITVQEEAVGLLVLLCYGLRALFMMVD
ncbi:TolC family protein [Verrucomicrobiota bacterium sgz303538]